MTALENSTVKAIYILSENNFLLSGVKAVLSNLYSQGIRFTVKQVPNSGLYNQLTQLNSQENKADVVNYFIAERHVFHLLKLKSMSPEGIFINPTITANELEKILTRTNNKIATLRSDFYYRKAHSHREVEVVSMLLDGISQKNIADRLGISVKTVSHHKQVAIKKGGFTNFNEYYLRNLSIHALMQHP